MRYNIISVDEAALTKLEMMSMLKSLNTNIISVKDELEAINLLNEKKQDIHAVIWTAHSADTECFSCIKKLKGREPGKSIPMIIVSQITDKKFIIKAIEAGAVEFIAKPYDEDTVLKKFCKVLKVPYERAGSRAVDEDILTFNFTEMFNREIKSASRGNHPLSILLLSIVHAEPDHVPFDEVDQMTQLVCRVLRTKLRETDTCFRYGADSLIVLLPFADSQGVEVVKEKIRTIYANHSVIKQKSSGFHLVMTSVSYPDDGKVKDRLLEKLEEDYSSKLSTL